MKPWRGTSADFLVILSNFLNPIKFCFTLHLSTCDGRLNAEDHADVPSNQSIHCVRVRLMGLCS